MIKLISLTGDRPTGPLHIGHLFGSLLSRKELEKNYESFVMAADIQGLTDNFEHPGKVRENVFEVTIDNLAVDLDPLKTTFFIQSQIPQIAELTVLYSNLVTINALRRNPTVKSEIEQKKTIFGQNGESVTYGFLGYPVSQAADITIVRADTVPVGEDQLPMIEQTREIVDKFHRIYGCNIFPIPQAKLSRAPRIIGLDGNAKMSKSLNNAIYLKDSPEETIQKLKAAKTDSNRKISYDLKNQPGISNLVLIYALSRGISPTEAVSELHSDGYPSASKGYGQFKIRVAEVLNSYLAPIREKRHELESRTDYIREVLESGRKKALKKAEETMARVREAMQINY